MSSDEVTWKPGEVNWDYYRSDLNVSKMAIKKPRPILNFEIPVNPQPPRYRPGSGPLSQPVDLRLVDDSTAFIIGKGILPLTDPGDPRQRRAYYIIGWPDLPAARPVVDCAKALEYVAPYTIEQWEHEDFLRREVEKEQAETEAALAVVAEAIAAEEKGKVVVGSKLLPHEKKKPGRKPKYARAQNMRPPTPQLDSEQEELLAKRRQGPSLSTPQKKKSRIAQLEAEMEMGPLDHLDEYVEQDEEIRRQLENEHLRGAAISHGEEEHDMDLLQAGTGAPNVASLSSASSARPAALEDAIPQRRNKASKFSHSTSALPQQKSSYSITSLPSQTQRPVSSSPIPLPQRPGFSSTSNVITAHRLSAVPSIEMRTLSMQGQTRNTALATPVLKSGSDVQAAPPSNSKHPSNGARGGFTPTNSFTPVDGYFPRSSKTPADESPLVGNSNEGILSSAKVKRDRKKKAPKLLQPSTPSEPAAEVIHVSQAEQEYVVKRLEDDSIVDGIQYFKVRWEGDWPPEQNPTWEPRENISADLVRAYLKRKAEKATNKGGPGSSKGKPKEKRPSTLKQWASNFNYSSVSEAFEGQAELDQINHNTHANDGPEDDDGLGGDAGEFLVVDKQKAEDRKTAEAQSRMSFSS